MKLLILTGIFPPDTGGPATYVPRIASALVDRGWSVEVLTAGQRTTQRSFPFTVHRVPRPVLRRLPRSVPLIHDRLNWADTVYVNGLELDHVAASLPYDTPSVLKVVGDRSWEKYRNRGNGSLSIDEYQHRFPGPRAWLDRSLHRWIGRQFDEYLVPSQYLKSLIGNWGIDHRKVHVVHNHSHPPDAVPSERLDWPGTDRRLLTAGRMVPWKRFPGLVETVAPLDRIGLLILGDGPEREQCERIIEERSLQDRVRLKGNVPRPTVWNHLEQSDLFLLNSTYEGFPHVLLESIRTGTPVLAADSGGSAELAEYFPEAITLYDREDPKALRHELLAGDCFETFEKPEWPDQLTWPVIVRRTAEILRSAN